jgi:F0F1-type ATP synthase assembly protein I
MRSMLGNDPFVMSCVVIIGICATILVIFIAALGAKRGPAQWSPGTRPDEQGPPPRR